MSQSTVRLHGEHISASIRSHGAAETTQKNRGNQANGRENRTDRKTSAKGNNISAVEGHPPKKTKSIAKKLKRIDRKSSLNRNPRHTNCLSPVTSHIFTYAMDISLL